VGHIDCVKDTRVVLDRTIGGEINEGCKALFGKFIVLNRKNSNVSIHDESPLVINQVYDLNFIALPCNVFVTGDLAFFATVLGKENMGGIWCPWCMLSKQKWSLLSHELGEEWTIEKLLQIREQVENNTLLPTPTNLKGCTETPLFDAAPISNYIVPVLHLLVGIGNILVDSLYF
jgi:hypothetical protein